MSLIEFIKPNVAKALTSLLLGMVVIYLGAINFSIGCSDYGCLSLDSFSIGKGLMFLVLWPVLLITDFSYVLFNEKNGLFLFCAFMLEFFYIYLIVCIMSHFVKKRI